MFGHEKQAATRWQQCQEIPENGSEILATMERYEAEPAENSGNGRTPGLQPEHDEARPMRYGREDYDACAPPGVGGRAGTEPRGGRGMTLPVRLDGM